MLSFTKSDNNNTLDLYAGQLYPTQGIINALLESDESCL